MQGSPSGHGDNVAQRATSSLAGAPVPARNRGRTAAETNISAPIAQRRAQTKRPTFLSAFFTVNRGEPVATTAVATARKLHRHLLRMKLPLRYCQYRHQHQSLSKRSLSS